jgi:hypothetical protein
MVYLSELDFQVMATLRRKGEKNYVVVTAKGFPRDSGWQPGENGLVIRYDIVCPNLGCD